MASTVKTRPNHYEVLGVAPTATDEEIARAFALEMSAFRPRAFGGLGDVSVAYQTLRDPVRRRAYDVAIGLLPQPNAPAPTPQWKPFMMHAAVRPAGRQHAQPPAAPVEREPQAEELAEAPFVAAPPSEPAGRDPRLDMFAALATPTPLRDPAPTPAAEAEPGPPAAGDFEPLQGAEDGLSPPFEDSAVDWKRTAAIGGGVVAAVGLIGAWAGWQASSDVQPAQAKAALTVPLPQPNPAPTASAPPAPSATARLLDRASQREAPAGTTLPTRAVPRAPAPRRPAASEDRLADISQALQLGAPAAEGAGEAAAAEAPPAAIAAAMPLPNAVIARTIGRIGYSCGQVASTTAVEGGAPGVFKVTCTSGHAYQATPVRGRYHFRRLGSR